MKKISFPEENDIACTEIEHEENWVCYEGIVCSMTNSHHIFRYFLQYHISLVWQTQGKEAIYRRERERRID